MLYGLGNIDALRCAFHKKITIYDRKVPLMQAVVILCIRFIFSMM